MRGTATAGSSSRFDLDGIGTLLSEQHGGVFCSVMRTELDDVYFLERFGHSEAVPGVKARCDAIEPVSRAIELKYRPICSRF